MKILLKLSLVALTLAIGTAALSRERRFLLDVTNEASDLVSAANSTFEFSWDVGNGKFPVKNKKAANDAIEIIYDETSYLRANYAQLSKLTRHLRFFTYYHPDFSDLARLNAVVTSLTRAIDAAVILRDVTWTYSWFEIIENETMDQADALDEGLQDVKIALIRLDMRITEAIDGSKKLKNFFESLDGVYMYEVMDKVGPQINES
ncbi:hypothetical protein RRG08_016424 [Elysia crispata]|uniref:Uncharacterized protein n=1 Tax=Elysia crispata TaxID=231223 RepID=A0AAE0YAD6_9GAST|nr:hypothetical protein RRG08_016424 [Elysia crispata]